MAEHYCSVCYWSTNDPEAFPPRWYCVLHRCAKIERDEDGFDCADWVDLRTELAR